MNELYVVYWHYYEEFSIMSVFDSLDDAKNACEPYKKNKNSKWRFDTLYEEWWISSKDRGAYSIAKVVKNKWPLNQI